MFWSSSSLQDYGIPKIDIYGHTCLSVVKLWTGIMCWCQWSLTLGNYCHRWIPLLVCCSYKTQIQIWNSVKSGHACCSSIMLRRIMITIIHNDHGVTRTPRCGNLYMALFQNFLQMACHIFSSCLHSVFHQTLEKYLDLPSLIPKDNPSQGGLARSIQKKLSTSLTIEQSFGRFPEKSV